MKRLTNTSFISSGNAKSKVIKALKDSLPPGWFCLVIGEKEDSITIEVRHIPSTLSDALNWEQ